MSSVVKSEPMDPNSQESRMLQIIISKPDGLTFEELDALLPVVSKETNVEALNCLLNKRLLCMVKNASGVITFKLQDPSSVKLLTGLDNQEKLVYQVIEAAGNKGIWNKIIEEKCNINNKILDKILRNLESKKLVKKTHSLASTRKKIYMLYNLEADESVTGGVFYSDQKFDSLYFDQISHLCQRILQQQVEMSKGRDLNPLEMMNAQCLSSEEILKTIVASNISKVKLTLADIESMLETLIYDCKAEKALVIERDNSQKTYYRISPSFIKSSGLVQTPCGQCPVRNDCRPGGEVSPEKCVYMSAWLEF